MTKLTAKTLREWRAQQLAAQGGVCRLCLRPIEAHEQAVADHDHKTGAMRGVLHDACNVILGKIENAISRNGSKVQDLDQVRQMLMNAVSYIRTPHSDSVRHPSHRNEAERRDRRNRRARLARKKVRDQEANAS